MSSKMLAGVVAGGFGVVLYIALIFSDLFSALLALFLALVLLLGPGVLAGALSGAWLELDDYGQQASAGTLSGLVAAGILEVCDLLFRLALAAIGKPNPTNLISNLLVSRVPNGSETIYLLLVVVINLLLYLVYLLVMVGISGVTANLVGRSKDTEALQAIIAANAPPPLDTPGGAGEETLDPALLPYQRPEYSPFVSDATPPPTLPPWQQRLLEQRQRAGGGNQSGNISAQRPMPGKRPLGNLPQNQRPPGPQSAIPGNPTESAYRQRLPTDRQRPKPRGREQPNG